MKLTKQEIGELENQLSCPKGENGILIGEKMHKSNIEMTRKSIEALRLSSSDSILELGHGNCGHLEEIVCLSDDIRYVGLEVSETMWQEAQTINSSGQAEFILYNGREIPFPDNTFERILTVNTIYFWTNPVETIKEIERTLKPGGICILTYAEKSFMEKLPFVGERFSLFDRQAIRDLVGKSSLDILSFKEEKDQVLSKSGEQVLREYTLVKIRKTSTQNI
jgi:SAM-dependent methyltransferase